MAKPIKQPSNVLIGYKRVSTVEQKDTGTSLEHQEKQIYGVAAIEGCQVAKVFADAHTGDDLWRPGLWNALQRLNCLDCEIRPMPDLALRNEGWLSVPGCSCGKLNGADGLIIWDMNRLSRRSKDLMFLVVDVLEKQGKRLIVCHGDLKCDTSTPIGKFLFQVMSALAEMDKALVLERMHDGWATAKSQKRFAAGAPPYGFMLQHGKKNYDENGRLKSRQLARLVPREDEMQAIKYILTLFYKKIPFTQIVTKLAKETPYRTRRGTFFDRKQVYRIVQGPEGQFHIPEVKDLYEKLHTMAIYDAKKVNMAELSKANASRLDTTGGAQVS